MIGFASIIQAMQGPRPPEEQYTEQQVAGALRASHGIVKYAARKLHCARGTIYRYMREFPALKTVRREAKGDLLDDAEVGLADAVRQRQPWAIRLVLLTLGKDRGYTYRLEQAGPRGEALIPPEQKVIHDVTPDFHAEFREFAESLAMALAPKEGPL